MQDLPTPRPTPSAPGRLAPDLEAGEVLLARRLAALPRARVGDALRARVLAGAPPARRLVPVSGGLRPWAAAAALLAGVALARSGTPAPRAPGPAAPRVATLCVVDDPNMSLFHGVETFERLALDGVSARDPVSPRR